MSTLNVAQCMFGENGRLYSYIIPEGVIVEPGSWVIVKGPKAGFIVLKVEAVQPFEKQSFKLKSVLGVLTDEQIAEDEAFAEENT